jgi:hypothetical protein
MSMVIPEKFSLPIRPPILSRASIIRCFLLLSVRMVEAPIPDIPAPTIIY